MIKVVILTHFGSELIYNVTTQPCWKRTHKYVGGNPRTLKKILIINLLHRKYDVEPHCGCKVEGVS